MVTILVLLWEFEGVAVGDVLGDVPVVRGTPGQAPEAKDLPGGAGCVADSLLLQHGRADAAGEGGQRGPSGVLVVSAANKFYPSPGQATHSTRSCSLQLSDWYCLTHEMSTQNRYFNLYPAKLPVSPGIYEDTAIRMYGDCSLYILHPADVVLNDVGLQFTEWLRSLIHLTARIFRRPHPVTLGEISVEIHSYAVRTRNCYCVLPPEPVLSSRVLVPIRISQRYDVPLKPAYITRSTTLIKKTYSKD